jgi:hypothetical protein
MRYSTEFHKLTMESFYYFRSPCMFHVSSKWMEGVSLLNELFECVSQNDQNGWPFCESTCFISTIKVLFHKYCNPLLDVGLCFRSSPCDPFSCFISTIKLVFHKYFNDVWVVGLCFTSLPRDPYSVSIMHELFDCVSQVEHEILQLFTSWPWNHSSVSVHWACFILVKNRWTMIQKCMGYRIVFTSWPWNPSSILVLRECFTLNKGM